jgi:hypothetical protein
MADMAEQWDGKESTDQQLRKIIGLLELLINVTVTGDKAIIAALTPPQPAVPTAVQITQITKGARTMAITGTPAGGSSTFEADAILNGVADPTGFPAGTVDTWTVDDPLITLGPDSGPDVNQTGTLDQVVVSVPATDTQGSAPAGSPGSYNLTVSVQMPAVAGVTPAPLVQVVNVPITSAPTPAPTGVVINQVS